MATVSDKVLAKRARRIYAYLYGRDHGPVSAITLAELLRLSPGLQRETLRRRVREAVDCGREELGFRICANGQRYWLARDARKWAAFREARKAKRRFGFVRDRQCQQAVTERFNKQGLLFDMGPIDRGEAVLRAIEFSEQGMLFDMRPVGVPDL